MRMASVVMGALAAQRGANEEAWRILGLLHNVDFDEVKEPERHCLVAAEWLREAARALDDPAWERLAYVLAWDNVWEVDQNCDFRVSSSPTVRSAFAEVMRSPAFG